MYRRRLKSSVNGDGIREHGCLSSFSIVHT